MHAAHNVLIVEDDEALAVALSDGFRYEGYAVATAGDGQVAVELAESAAPDLIILDVMLPRASGLDVCKTLRARGDGVPIIMLTARGQEIDKVLGLKLGADDYVTKPFSFMELLARAEAILRRSGGRVAAGGSRCRIGELEVDFRRHEALRDGRPVELSAREYELLRYLDERRGRVVTREELLDAVWGYDAIPFTRTVDVHVAKLRKKLEAVPSEPRCLVTVHRVGYKLLEA
ncbi:MAG TPA: response regulator transcription factor [Thermoanaerobaculia bacterium]